jgi:CDP-glucose 4,6-dehydratase
VDFRQGTLESMGVADELFHTYRGKKVFLTGHTGFKGAWFLKLFAKLGAIVKGYSLHPDSGSLYEQISGDSLCQSVIADIRNYGILSREIDSFQPDFVFHLAAQSLVRKGYKEPIATFETNVMGTANMLEAIRGFVGRSTAIMITTDKVYQNPESGQPFVEDDALGGFDPYSASKAAAEIVIAGYRCSYFDDTKIASHQKSVSSARAGNVIGGGDWSEDRLIPDVIRALLKDEEVIIRNPDAVRPWQHVLEPLFGYLILGMRQSQRPTGFNEAWNFGPESDAALTVGELVERIIKMWGSGKVNILKDSERHEAKYLRLNISKASALGWAPRMSLDESIEWTVKWYRTASKDPAGSGDTMDRQIDSYLKRLA